MASDVAGTSAVTVRLTDAPAASVPTGHVTICPVAVQPGDAAGSNVTPVGNSSTIVTPSAVFGPPFVAVNVDVTVAPAATGSGAVVLASRTSACWR